MPKKIDVNEFCKRVNKAYDGRISIVKETYIDTIHKVTAYCNVHKIYFECSRAKKLYEKVSNCPECSKLNQRNKHIKDWESVYKSFENKYGNKFSYDSSSYKGTKELMKVHCNDCGTDFEITPEHHLKYNNGGCPNCAENKIVKCSKCGKEIEVNKHSKILSEMYCDECQKENSYKYCDICGRMLNDEDICANEFCRNHNIQQFKTLIRYFGFDEQKLRTIYVEKEFNRIRNILNNMYWNKHMSSSEICKIFDYPDCSNLTRKVFKYLEIVPKTSHYSSIENIKMNRRELPTENNYKDSYHITWDNKEVYLRSSYEKDYANFLDLNKVIYEVEKLRIDYFDTQKRQERLSIPDFYLPETNTIVEVKSKWTLDKQNMIDKRKAYLELGYNFKLLYEHEFVELDDLELKDNINNHRK